MTKIIAMAAIIGLVVAGGYVLSAQADDSGLVCSKTGETLGACCCETIDGQLVCGKTGEVLEQCCCSTG